MKAFLAVLGYLGIAASMSWFGFVAYHLNRISRMPYGGFSELKPMFWFCNLGAVAVFACSIAALTSRKRRDP
jgi:hypothetical protein